MKTYACFFDLCLNIEIVDKKHTGQSACYFCKDWLFLFKCSQFNFVDFLESLILPYCVKPQGILWNWLYLRFYCCTICYWLFFFFLIELGEILRVKEQGKEIQSWWQTDLAQLFEHSCLQGKLLIKKKSNNKEGVQWLLAKRHWLIRNVTALPCSHNLHLNKFLSYIVLCVLITFFAAV